MDSKLPILAFRVNALCRTCLCPVHSSSSSRNLLLQRFRSRHFTTTNLRAGIAAPPIDFSGDSLSGASQGVHEGGPPEGIFGFDDLSDSASTTSFPRVVPASPSYFTGKPSFTDNLISLQAILRKFQTLPTLAPAQAPRAAWRTLSQYRVMVGEPVKASKYYKIIEVLRRLNRIHPALMPEEVVTAINHYKRDVDPFAMIRRPQTVDADGRSFGAGRRKASTAKVYLVEGEGEVLVNGKTLNQAFPRIHDRESAIWALKATARVDKYNVWAIVAGGGLTGQAESITLAVAKALMVHEPALKPALRRGKSTYVSVY
jgi:small subunit ribosomal protein S9